MLTDQHKEAALRARAQATVALQNDDLASFDSIRSTTLHALHERLDEIRQQAIQADDATEYDAAARFCLEVSDAFHQQRQAYVGAPPPQRGESHSLGSGPMYPLPTILAMVERGEVASVEVHDWGLYDPPQPDVLHVQMRLHPAAEEAEFARRGRRSDGPYRVSLLRTPPSGAELMSETVRRLSRLPISPTRDEVNDLLRAIEAYNATHEPSITVTVTR